MTHIFRPPADLPQLDERETRVQLAACTASSPITG